MNICIVTVYNSENCGSFYQAYALKSVLEKLGRRVVFLHRDVKGTSHSLIKAVTNIVRTFSSGRPIWTLKSLRRYIVFEKTVSRCFHTLKRKSREIEKVDCFVIGSDVLWNFDSPYFQGKKDIYCGSALGNKKKITYAVSVGNTDSQTILNDNEVVDGIRGLNAISVRDERTREVVFRLLGTNPTLVLDPTLLLDESEYYQMESSLKLDNFILIYGFEEVPEDVKLGILALKAKSRCKIVSYGQYRKWVDVNTIYDPTTFLSYFHQAKYVVTDTFHGTVFSIVYKKSFACYGLNKEKIKSLLQDLSLTSRFIRPGESIEEKLSMKSDYVGVYKTITQLRKESMKFLEENTREC